MDTPAPHYRRNFAALLGDALFFGMAITFASSTTTLPDYVDRLTGSPVVVGLFTAAASGAWLLPQLIYAQFLTNKRRKKGYVILGASLGRPFYLLYAAALWLGLLPSPPLALVFLFVVQIIFMGTDAMAAVAWFDLYAKAIPENRRGRLVGIAQATRGVLSMGAGVLIAALLGRGGPPFPYNYAALFALSGGFLFLSLFSLSLVVEPDEPVQEERPAWRDYVPQLLNTVRQDRAFRRLLLVRLLAGFDGLALSLYILFATGELGLDQGTVGLFTSVQTVGGILASVGLGAISERVGSHRVIQISTALALTAPLVGLGLFLSGVRGGAMATAICAWVFLVIGIVLSAAMLGFFNYVLELAPPGQRPTYMGVFNTGTGLLLVLPPLGGWLRQSTNYGVLFGVTAAILAAAHVLSWGLPSARHAPAGGTAEIPPA